MKKNKWKLTFYIGILPLFLLMAGVYGYGQKSGPGSFTDRAEVLLSDSSKPAMIKASVHMGSIRVSGYNGKNVVVEAKTVTKPVKEKDEEKEGEKEAEKVKDKAKGMYLIRNNRTGLSITEENNVVSVRVLSLSRSVDVNIKVPYRSSLKLKGLNSGSIEVENVAGEIDASHLNGAVTLKNVSGTVIAHSLNGGVTVTFDKVNLDKPMSFTTLNGDVDVTFPKNAKFNLKMKSEQGEIYSDFKLTMKQTPPPADKAEKKEGKYIIKFDKSVYALLNGGGEEIQFKTFTGDIYIRTKK